MEEPLSKGRIRRNETRFCEPREDKQKWKRKLKGISFKREEGIIAAEKQKFMVEKKGERGECNKVWYTRNYNVFYSWKLEYSRNVSKKFHMHILYICS